MLSALKDAGYSTYRLRKDKIFGERVIQQLRNGDPVSWEVLSRLCNLLNCDVGDVVTYSPGDDTTTRRGNPGSRQARGNRSM